MACQFCLGSKHKDFPKSKKDGDGKGRVPLPTQSSWLTKRSKASHSGVSKGSKHSLQTQIRIEKKMARRFQIPKVKCEKKKTYLLPFN